MSALRCIFAACLVFCYLPAHAASLMLDELSWTELRVAIASGKTTVIIPVGGTEQSGPHIALGKHNVRVKILAEKIAATLGNAIVAPVLSYVPEGSISPPAGHMRFPGTISVSEEAFRGILEGAARSLKQAGFLNVVLIGDHGGYQDQLKTVVSQLNREWRGTSFRAFHIDEYYRAASTSYADLLREKGYPAAQIGVHAGLADTALMLATDAALVRMTHLPPDVATGRAEGVSGDPHGASAALGQPGVDLIVAKSVAAIRSAIANRNGS